MENTGPGQDVSRNEEVIRIEGIKGRYLMLNKRKSLGHIMKHDSLQRDQLEDMVQSKRGKGRGVLP